MARSIPISQKVRFARIPPVFARESLSCGCKYSLGCLREAVPRNSVATNLNMFGGSGGLVQPSSMAEPQQRPMSTFSLATTANPYATTPSQSTDPTDEEFLQVLHSPTLVHVALLPGQQRALGLPVRYVNIFPLCLDGIYLPQVHKVHFLQWLKYFSSTCMPCS